LTKIRTPNFERYAPPPLASLAVPQKSFLRNFYFARARFFLLKGKENFFAELCSERAGRRGLAFRAGGPPKENASYFLRGKQKFLFTP